MTPDLWLNAPPLVDWMLAAACVVAACGHALVIATSGHSIAQWLQMVGWFGLGSRIGIALVMRGDVSINPFSVAFIAFLAGGTIISAWRQQRIAAADVRCQLDPEQQCMREDRAREHPVKWWR